MYKTFTISEISSFKFLLYALQFEVQSNILLHIKANNATVKNLINPYKPTLAFSSYYTLELC